MRRIWIFIIIAIGVVAGFSRTPALNPEEVRLRVREVAGRAAEGDPEAIYQMATIYERGFDSIPRDSIKAVELYREAAGKGNLNSQNYLGYYLIKNAANPSDASEGLEWLEKAAIAGDPKAQSNIGFLLLGGNGVEQDYEKAAFWLERAAAAGVATASSMLGDLYRDGLGVARDSLQAEAHYYAAFDAGLADAAYKLEAMSASQWAQSSDEEQLATALHFYTRRAPQVAIPILVRLSDGDSGNIGATMDSLADNTVKARASALLGDAYTRGLGVAYNHEKSTEYYFKGALLGDSSAAFIISELLEIFPDALQDISSEMKKADQIRAGEINDAELNDPQYWRTKAAESGVTSAEEAMRHLFSGV